MSSRRPFRAVHFAGLALVAILSIGWSSPGNREHVRREGAPSARHPQGSGAVLQPSAIHAHAHGVMVAHSRKPNDPYMVLDTTHDFAESTARWFLTNTGTSELVASTNTSMPGAAWDLTQRTYGCSNDGGHTFAEWYFPGLSNNGGDDTLAARLLLNATLYSVNLLFDGSYGFGIRVWRTSDACPADGSAPFWNWYDFDLSDDYFSDPSHTRNLDQPRLLYAPSADRVFISWTIDDPSLSYRQAWLAYLSADDLNLYPAMDPSTQYGVQAVNMAVDDLTSPPSWACPFGYCSSISGTEGYIHLVYQNLQNDTVEHGLYDIATDAFVVPVRPVGSWTYPAETCPGHSDILTIGATDTWPYGGVASGHFKWSPLPTIMYDRDWKTVIVSYSTNGASGTACQAVQEQRFYRSLDFGYTWDYIAVTGCLFSLQPSGTYVSSAGVDHIMSTYVVGDPNNAQVAQVDWASPALGDNWTGVYVTNPRTMTSAQNSRCWWGDYTGAAEAVFSGNSSVMYNWGEPNDPFGNWAVNGVFVVP